jgi:hypothetical protein
MNQATKDLFQAAMSGNIEGIQLALKEGADINAVDQSHESALSIAIFYCDDDQLLMLTTAYLLDHGADPDFRGKDNTGVLFHAALRMNPELMKMLLERGANPNIILDGDESLYDWSEFTYRYHAYDVPSHALEPSLGMDLPLFPTDEDRASEESWLRFLDRCADVAGVTPPSILWVMRQYGAKTTSELNNPKYS